MDVDEVYNPVNLVDILDNNIIYEKIINYLDDETKCSLSYSSKDINEIMTINGYRDTIVIGDNNGMEEYLSILDIYYNHRYWIKTIILKQLSCPFNFLPDIKDKNVKIVCKNCDNLGFNNRNNATNYIKHLEIIDCGSVKFEDLAELPNLGTLIIKREHCDIFSPKGYLYIFPS